MGLGQWLEIGRMDELGRLDTPAHRLDARAKVITTIVFIVVVMSFPRYEVSALTPFFLYPFALIALGRIPPGYILRKILLAAPFALVVGMFNPLLDHQVIASVGVWSISGGWLSFASIMLRFVLTVSAALTLIACTGIYRLGAGLERMCMPRVFVVQLLFLYRYLFVIVDEGARMMRSLELRSARPSSLRLRVYGSLVGHLLLRSMARADRVYRAMAARGFDGKIRALHRASFQWTDWAFTGGWTAFFAIARMWNLADALGRILAGGGS
ncbi:MAG: cobalt ECF transporter T component CbiQ [Verrucomicrobia bacterium]|nr:cobalt ECF transporter T component CbiQ [Verrucomicrobiota bacterium]MBU1734270.1 cobalt ECF transporter T component CbiQ [Verrucomicrobiota bacterium]MBU1855851.1 cobalt ECF transporter T component CbiQ [Verrucomicrobiota bacterium]